MDENSGHNIFYSNLSRELTASREMNRMKFNLNNDVFSSNVYWLRFAYSGHERWNYNFHNHSFYEFHYCVLGEAEYELSTGEKFLLAQDEFLLFPPKTYHSIKRVSDDYIRFTLGFDITVKNNEDTMFKSVFSSRVQAERIMASRFMRDLIENIMKQVMEREPAYVLVVGGLLELVIIEAARHVSSKNEFEVITNESEDMRLEKLIKFMRDNVRLKLTSEDFAREMNLSVKQINRWMNEAYGMSVSEYFKAERMKQIGKLLTTTDLRISDIAMQFGYEEEYSMSKTFKRVMGMSPGQFRIHYHK